jgi:hypothetical protein
MSKYKTKQQLLDEISKEKLVLDNTISILKPKNLAKRGACEDWSVKDIVCHLAEWQAMVLKWHEEGKKGNTPEVPKEGYKWSQLPELNNTIYIKYKDYSWEEAKLFFKRTEKKVMELINESDEETLLKPGLYPWMNNNTLIAYLGSCTSSHYKWASGLIKKFAREI